jgi:lipid II:glycine glycyltransferase (peptidoglycan interpeptide bridge formation enzyme)
LDDGRVFVRFEPLNDVKTFGFKKTFSVSPKTTLITSLEKSEEKLLSSFHQKTRYNINLAKRKGVKIEIAKAWELDIVWPLFEETAKRDGFRLHDKKHYEELLKLKSNNLKVFLAVAFYENRPLAANIMVDFNGTRTYLHGASSNSNRNVMAPFLLHWELLTDAQAKGLKFYDWWGIASSDDPKDPWAGITRFKKGFGGETVRSPGTFDYVLKPSGYLIYKIIRCLKRFL